MTFVHVHASGRFDRSPASLETALDTYVYHEHADLLTLTEVSGNPRSSTLPESQWSVVQSKDGGRKSDSAILFNNNTWTLRFQEVVPIVQGDGSILPVWAVFAVLKHESGKVVVVSSAHLPRSVEGKTGFSKVEAKRVRATLSGSQQWRQHANGLYREWDADAILLAADWNLNIKKSWVQRWFKKSAPAYDANWQGKMPVRGTLGKRIIDIALLRGLRVVSREILPHNKSSDHTPYREVLEFKGRQPQ